MAETDYEKFRKLLAELFLFDQADLDFGIYRIMNAKRGEISKFLDQDLLPQVKESLSALDTKQRNDLEKELAEALEGERKLGLAADSSPRVQELRKSLAGAVKIEDVESEVFSHLYDFFSRYYDAGDFISKRRYKPGVYAIPYEGEEVKLYWANSDQYYIKTTEHFRDYAFRLPDGRRAHFKIVAADTELNNNKPTNGNQRRFVLAETEPVIVQDGELLIRFEYKPDTSNSHSGSGEAGGNGGANGKASQAERNVEAAKRIVNDPATAPWVAALLSPSKNPEKTVLDRHLAEYTARNTFDYFIHKDLGGFLRRELDFFIKNEIVHLDDIESQTSATMAPYLIKVKALRRIAGKIIEFLAQLENFQKKLWLKKKFVIDTNYCITLDRIPEEFYAEIANNNAQREEWVKLFAIDEIQPDIARFGYSIPLTTEFLKANSNLVVDTQFFSSSFTIRLFNQIRDVDAVCNGLLVDSENFHAVSLLTAMLAGRVKHIYIDPPYNTDSAPILYKNDYRNSSWICLVRDRLAAAKYMLTKSGVTTIAIDDTEISNLSKLVEELFPEGRITRVTVVHNPKGSITKDFNRVHEYAVFVTPEAEKDVIARALEENNTPRRMRRWGENSRRQDRPLSFYPIYSKEAKVVRIGVVPPQDFHPAGKNVELISGEIEIWPIDQDGVERRWNFGLDSISGNLQRIAVQEVDGKLDLFVTHELTVPKTVWSGGKYDSGKYGNTLLIDMLGTKLFDFPKSINLVRDCVKLATSQQKDATVLDFFAGSGTTGHAVLSLNRDDGGQRRFVLVDMDNFARVLKPRMQKAIYSHDWQEGKPLSRKGSSFMLKYVKLESYEDALNNLILRPRTGDQQSLLDGGAGIHEDYMLRYMLDTETSGSKSILSVNQFENPFGCTMDIATDTVGETRPVNVDLVETFNYLLGLRVKRLNTVRGFKIVVGNDPEEKKVLVIWRNTKEKSNAELDAFFTEQGYNTPGKAFDVVYVNGDNNLENLRRDGEKWTVRLIEEDFQRLMLDVKDV
jgi:adenine-specific DNA-methyltransferase